MKDDVELEFTSRLPVPCLPKQGRVTRRSINAFLAAYNRGLFYWPFTLFLYLQRQLLTSKMWLALLLRVELSATR